MHINIGGVTNKKCLVINNGEHSAKGTWEFLLLFLQLDAAAPGTWSSGSSHSILTTADGSQGCVRVPAVQPLATVKLGL